MIAMCGVIMRGGCYLMCYLLKIAMCGECYLLKIAMCGVCYLLKI